jgi:type II secretory ATPase GspE/PulE/Tfp pilus assembly ATPase PilB-like protein
MSTTSKPRARFAEELIAAGLLTEPQLDLALLEQKRGGQQLGQILVQLGFVRPEVLAEYLAKQTETRPVNLNSVAIDPAALRLVPADLARRFRVMPIVQSDHTLTLAMANPFDVVAIDTLHQTTGLTIEVVTAPERDILNCQELFYIAGDTIEESIDQILAQKARETARPLDEVLAEMGNKPEDAPVIRLVSRILTHAINSGASDIHFEPEERMMRVRTRVDGILFQELLIPKAMQSAVCTRVKILADLDVAESRLPQDGRATVLVGGRQVNLRVSSLPTSFGENIVARILDPSAQILTLPALGLLPDTEEEFRELVGKPYGVILVTGPTGSGKSTTLYAVLQEISTIDVSIYTLEDPIEYRMSLVRQTQIKEEIGLTFGNGLRALLRQDPDIILVGETRDTETAQLMVRAALTGHLVFSTLHTNDAAGAVPRLIDMGVEPFLLPSSLLAILGQRLVRKICKNCKQEIPDADRMFEGLRTAPPVGMPARLFRGVGCPDCKDTGYKGRIGIFEMMTVDEQFHDAIVARAGAPEYLRLAKEHGMRTMLEDGLIKAVQGLTTVEELFRATRI